ncbi:MAG: choloylglycine hydrolase family protein [Bosea sp.]|nr:choloylglycine hydrolase family protein [Bosea sp. (in: a-proteobacteria)]
MLSMIEDSVRSARSPAQRLRSLGTLLLAASMLTSQAASACTSFLIPTSDNGAVYGRTMEFGFELESRAMMIPRNYKLASSGADGKPAASWTSKYAAVGLNALGVTALVDGMNEKGLVGGILYFPGFAGYADAGKSDPAKSLAPWDVLTWALTNFATIAEVKAALEGMAVIGVEQQQMKMVPPVHYTLHDASGASLVIEPIDGKLKLYDNPLGVMTNSPPFDWHLNNIRNYVKMSPVAADPLKIGGKTFEPFGQGSGLLGIPGDPTPPSRFIRALGYAASAKQQPDGPQTVRLVEHIMNNFDIPIGFINSAAKGGELEYTQWTSVADLRARKYYIKGYRDQVLRMVDLSSFDLDAKGLRVAPFKVSLTPPPLEFAKP